MMQFERQTISYWVGDVQYTEQWEMYRRDDGPYECAKKRYKTDDLVAWTREAKAWAQAQVAKTDWDREVPPMDATSVHGVADLKAARIREAFDFFADSEMQDAEEEAFELIAEFENRWRDVEAFLADPDNAE
jgi:hypothetical protein